MSQPTCKERVRGELADRLKDLRQLWEAYQRGEEEVKDLGSIHDYGLSFDYVAPNTFRDQPRGYFRYQLSWGGPSDEFRFYCDEGFRAVCIEYWFLGWFDGAHITLRPGKRGGAYELLAELFGWFEEAGSVEAEYKKAKEG